MGIGRVMALDVGKVRVGVAITDGLGITAQPLMTLWRKSRGEDVSVWGGKVLEFAAELRGRVEVPVTMWDERLSSVAAHEILDAAGHDRRDRKDIIDQVAAVVILQGWMEAKERAAVRAKFRDAGGE
jgi:putative Holliday junction resolvase